MAKTSYLPPDIIQIILLKIVPVKALLRFKSVSKSWNSIISDPLFVKNHHQQSKSSNSQDLFICYSRVSDRFSLVKLEEEKLETVQLLPSPSDYCISILCRYEGLLLLSNHYSKPVLWNPKSQTKKKIWIPSRHGSGSSYGLCPDPTTDGFGFKVVIVNKDNYSVCSVNNNKSLITKRKKSDGLYTDYGPIICNDTPVCVDGAVYWVWSRENVDDIIYYDPRDDNFNVLRKPEYVEEGKRIFLVDLEGSLCLHCLGRDTATIKIWIKEKGIGNDSWKDLMTIENVMIGVWSFEPQCLVGDKIVFRDKIRKDLVVYSPLDKRFEQLRDIQFTCYGNGLFRYLDSPLGERKG